RRNVADGSEAAVSGDGARVPLGHALRRAMTVDAGRLRSHADLAVAANLGAPGAVGEDARSCSPAAVGVRHALGRDTRSSELSWAVGVRGAGDRWNESDAAVGGGRASVARPCLAEPMKSTTGNVLVVVSATELRVRVALSVTEVRRFTTVV